MKTFALIGHPVSHSLSPKLHNAVFQALGLKDHEYMLRDTPPEDLELALKELREGKYQGYSVTIPHKQTVMRFCDEWSENAERVGAVNTVVRRGDGKLFGENTDYFGFGKSLEEAGVKRQKTLVLGSGGAAKAVIAVLVDQGFSVTVAVRKKEKAVEGVELQTYEKLDPEHDYSLIINTTPVGMVPHSEASPLLAAAWFTPERIFADVIYTPKMTAFLKKAEEAGAKIITGDRMFLWQAVGQASLFTGRSEAEVAQAIMKIS